MAILNKDQIWAADDIQERVVLIPQWEGGEVRIRSLTLEQVATIRAHAVKTVKGKEEVDARLQMAGLLCEGIVEPEFDFNEAQRLMRKSSAAVSLIVQAINEVSGLLPDAVAEADKSDGEGSGSGIRVLPIEGARDDTRPARGKHVES
jgi:hypothetical protein